MRLGKLNVSGGRIEAALNDCRKRPRAILGGAVGGRFPGGR